MGQLSINKKMANLPFPTFEKWFEKHKQWSHLDARKEYEKIGGKVPVKKSSKDE